MQSPRAKCVAPTIRLCCKNSREKQPKLSKKRDFTSIDSPSFCNTALVFVVLDRALARLLLACAVPNEQGAFAERAAVRNRTILWVFYDAGIRVSELINLRVKDLDRKHGIITVTGKGSKERRIAERNFVKKAVNWALRQIGKRNATLRASALEWAEQIRAMDSKTAQWIANDAIKELLAHKAKKNALEERPSS